jgi:hypothetical protein
MNLDEYQKYCPGLTPVPTILPSATRIVAIGDIHGDYWYMIDLLVLAKLIVLKTDCKDRSQRGGGERCHSDRYLSLKEIDWIAEPDTVVVQVGDQIDRCRPREKPCTHPSTTPFDEASDIEILRFLTALHILAQLYKCGVYSLLGNHEILNSQGVMTYVSYKGIEQFNDYKDPKDPERKFASGEEARKHAFKPGNEYAVMMACTRVAVLIVGDILFVHAAVLPQLLKRYKIDGVQGIEHINQIIRHWLWGIVESDEVTELLTSMEISPFWPRVLGYIPPHASMEHEHCQSYVKPVLDILHLNGMVIGHTPQYYAHKEGINGTCDNTLLRADIGGSRAFFNFQKLAKYKDIKRRSQVVEIVYVNGKQTFRVLEK